MEKHWFNRLVLAIENDGRPMKAISLDAGCGPNYVQQMIKDGKRPGTDRFIRLLRALGRPASLYIILGSELSAEDEELLRIVSPLSDEKKRSALRFFRDLLSS